VVAGDAALLAELNMPGCQRVCSLRLPSQGMVVMGLIRKPASIVTPGGARHHSRRDPQAKAARAQAELDEAETKVAGEQAAAIASALHETRRTGKRNWRRWPRKRPRPCRGTGQLTSDGKEERNLSGLALMWGQLIFSLASRERLRALGGVGFSSIRTRKEVRARFSASTTRPVT